MAPRAATGGAAASEPRREEPGLAPAVYLIDASPYIFRAYFSLPESIATPEGESVNAVYGWAAFLIKLIADERPAYLAAAYDGSLTTSFRNELYPDYKAQRALPPAELEAQLDRCREVAEALGVPGFIDDRYEADDIVGTLARHAAAAGHPVVVVSSDKDLAQLVEPRVTLYDFARGMRMGPDEVVEKFGVRPDQVPDLLGLAGDSVDNIPGVPGIGAKGAAALLAETGDLASALERLDEVAELPIRGARSLAGRLSEHRDQALLSRRLATVVTDAPFATGPDELRYRGADRERLEALFDRLGFASLRERVPRWAGEDEGLNGDDDG